MQVCLENRNDRSEYIYTYVYVFMCTDYIAKQGVFTTAHIVIYMHTAARPFATQDPGSSNTCYTVVRMSVHKCQPVP